MTELDLVGFAKAMMEEWPDGCIDTDTLQELGERFGLLVPVERLTYCDEPDDGRCKCREYEQSYKGQPWTCYRRVPLTSPKDLP